MKRKDNSPKKLFFEAKKHNSGVTTHFQLFPQKIVLSRPIIGHFFVIGHKITNTTLILL